MARTEPLRVLPATRAGAIGAVLAALSLVVLVTVIALNSPGTGRNPLAYAWAFVVLGGAIEVYAIARRHERSLLGFVALLPFGLLIVLLLMELTGLME
ncbi:MAG: hypothetical protein ACR2JV_08190 [Gaiellales bacterium]